MREIKFRSWHINKKIMISPAVIDQYGGAYESEYDFIERNIMDCNLMQFTGLLDKEGNEIYEGDIIAWENNEADRETIEWEGIGWNPFVKDMIDHYKSIRYIVIGNKYEGVR